MDCEFNAADLARMQRKGGGRRREGRQRHWTGWASTRARIRRMGNMALYDKIQR